MVLFFNFPTALLIVASAACDLLLIRLQANNLRTVPLYVRALADNLAHALVAGLSWVVVIAGQKWQSHKPEELVSKSGLAEVILCASLGSLVDVDHFIESRSLNLQEAVSLNRRSFLHCSTIPLVVWLLSLALNRVFGHPEVERLGCIFLVAFLSHHIRDAWRRGFWLAPLGHLHVPYALSFAMLIFLPALVAAYMSEELTPNHRSGSSRDREAALLRESFPSDVDTL